LLPEPPKKLKYLLLDTADASKVAITTAKTTEFATVRRKNIFRETSVAAADASAANEIKTSKTVCFGNSSDSETFIKKKIGTKITAAKISHSEIADNTVDNFFCGTNRDSLAEETPADEIYALGGIIK
jgi:hypothetical protein